MESVTREELLAFLNELSVPTTCYSHEPVFSVGESEALYDLIPGGHVKNLFVKDKKGNKFLIVALHEADIDLKSASKAIGAQGRVSFCRAEQLEDALGVTPGSVTPLALINDREAQHVQPIFDWSMMQHETLNCHPLLNNETVSIPREGLLRFVEACGHNLKVLPLSRQAQEAQADEPSTAQDA
ncbi:prolyl-tRNA synthetase associated domain-containing protein [Polycladidibacter hongkongensis]|uniref:prolyl-tRNA synthetase associated domain-containing protein n=1 Tax=Polycladidibacter hongkongensis TaxID=1647556 RepID=UPI00082F57A4|nr:prolyl-tRNA synthetase associated domain-containing protein [Pseudovibrio hongkongensis]